MFRFQHVCTKQSRSGSGPGSSMWTLSSLFSERHRCDKLRTLPSSTAFTTCIPSTRRLGHHVWTAFWCFLGSWRQPWHAVPLVVFNKACYFPRWCSIKHNLSVSTTGPQNAGSILSWTHCPEVLRPKFGKCRREVYFLHIVHRGRRSLGNETDGTYVK